MRASAISRRAASSSSESESAGAPRGPETQSMPRGCAQNAQACGIGGKSSHKPVVSLNAWKVLMYVSKYSPVLPPLFDFVFATLEPNRFRVFLSPLSSEMSTFVEVKKVNPQIV